MAMLVGEIMGNTKETNGWKGIRFRKSKQRLTGEVINELINFTQFNDLIIQRRRIK